MSDSTRTAIVTGLERAFVCQGFARPGVDDLRAAAGVSLRTLYKYYPSREAMILGALEHRHRRYVQRLLDGLPADPREALDAVFERVAGWMRTEASHGCLFHGAVAAVPDSAALRELLERHKEEVARRTAAAADLRGCEAELTLILEGLTQSWTLNGDEALRAAKRLGACLVAAKGRN
ncbi:TetR/AcrR family transcriptional regulator [Jiella avicenniae]|uniref:TetR/AcrR family transcriptional regulator n=1 Tax=Jiella avicenniae TaxID=2907202 RepID=A0A9X1T555_9HYPH|nr:TetR/AcrR family transcriptional regulator [Jiella avicenniae]MCE7029291.1 TetR/AcrR family transcriptional regulator [Jiella avicenniae]